MMEIAKMKELAKREADKTAADSFEKSFVFASYVFLNVLIADYWEKSAKQRIPKLMKEVLSLYDTFMNGKEVLSYQEMIDFVEKESGYRIVMGNYSQEERNDK